MPVVFSCSSEITECPLQQFTWDVPLFVLLPLYFPHTFEITSSPPLNILLIVLCDPKWPSSCIPLCPSQEFPNTPQYQRLSHELFPITHWDGFHTWWQSWECPGQEVCSSEVVNLGSQFLLCSSVLLCVVQVGLGWAAAPSDRFGSSPALCYLVSLVLSSRSSFVHVQSSFYNIINIIKLPFAF